MYAFSDCILFFLICSGMCHVILYEEMTLHFIYVKNVWAQFCLEDISQHVVLANKLLHTFSCVSEFNHGIQENIKKIV